MYKRLGDKMNLFTRFKLIEELSELSQVIAKMLASDNYGPFLHRFEEEAADVMAALELYIDCKEEIHVIPVSNTLMVDRLIYNDLTCLLLHCTELSASLVLEMQNATFCPTDNWRHESVARSLGSLAIPLNIDIAHIEQRQARKLKKWKKQNRMKSAASLGKGCLFHLV